MYSSYFAFAFSSVSSTMTEEHCQDLDVVAATALLLGGGAEYGRSQRGSGQAQGADEHSLSVLTRELLTAAGCTSLEITGVRCGLARSGRCRARRSTCLVPIRWTLGVSVDAALAVLDDCAVLPGAFPQLVADVQELVSDIVALIVRDLGGQALVLSTDGR